jgi:hypothetical protein
VVGRGRRPPGRGPFPGPRPHHGRDPPPRARASPRREGPYRRRTVLRPACLQEPLRPQAPPPCADQAREPHPPARLQRRRGRALAQAEQGQGEVPAAGADPARPDLKDGSLYATKVVTIPCDRGGDFEHRVLVNGKATTKDGFNRNEYLRVYGELENAWRPIYSRRVDAERAIRTVKRNLTDDRLPAYGPVRQTTVMLLMSHASNCQSSYLHHNPAHLRTGPPEVGRSARHPDADRPPAAPPGTACCCQHSPGPEPPCRPCGQQQHGDCTDLVVQV